MAQQNGGFWTSLLQSPSVATQEDALVAIYSQSPQCPYASATVLPSLLSWLVASSPQTTLLIKTPFQARLMEASKRAGWDVRQLQAFRKARFVDQIDAAPAPHCLYVLDCVDLWDGADVGGMRALLDTEDHTPVVMTSGTAINAVLRRASVQIECAMLEPLTRDVHGRVTVRTRPARFAPFRTASLLFRATEAAMLAASPIK